VITTPNRLEQIVKDLEQSNPIDFDKVATLQGLDLAIAGKQAVEQAIERELEFDANLEEQIRGINTRAQ